MSSMNIFSVSLDEFKKNVAEFCKSAPYVRADELENGFKAISLMYLSPHTQRSELDEIMFRSYQDYAMKVFSKHSLAHCD